MANLTEKELQAAQAAANALQAKAEGNREWEMPPIPKSIDTWPKLEEFATSAGLEFTNRNELVSQVKAHFPDFDITQVKTVVGDILRDIFEYVKKVFQGGIWVHFDVDPQTGKIVVRLSFGEHGPEITRRPLSQKEAKRVLEHIKRRDLVALRRHPDIKKLSRLRNYLRNVSDIKIKEA